MEWHYLSKKPVGFITAESAEYAECLGHRFARIYADLFKLNLTVLVLIICVNLCL